MDAADWTNLLTAFMGAATLWMAFATRKMAKVSADALALEARPYLSLDTVEFGIGKPLDLVAVQMPGVGESE